jgi:pimeloyl-ACP methyl ester carboxylesterase
MRLRGAARLATEATTALADLVEAMHERIARLPGSRARLDGRTNGITGLVYKSIRGVNRVVGGSLDALLGVLAPVLGDDEVLPRREAVISALNGVLGDYLVSTANPLAVPMALRVDGRPLRLERAALEQRLPLAGDEVLVLIHGLCMNDLQWRREDHDHGSALARELGLTAVYLHYNTGMHVSSNGRHLARQLQVLLAAWPRRVKRLVLLGHSMGGLVARSALHYGRQDGLDWVAKASDLVCLGTPHHGAPLERIGNWVEVALGAAPYTPPLARLARLRSAGITDLCHGYICEARDPVPLPRGVRCFALAGSTSADRTEMKGRILGDGLVPLQSALGKHTDPARTLRFTARRQAVEWRTNHMQLLSSPGVMTTLQRWLKLADSPRVHSIQRITSTAEQARKRS